ncbi:MAG: M48 family metalloprotease [Acidobacteriales bacterium]|nr:M48 family metalloprotease [Terriglobales bacterium]
MIRSLFSRLAMLSFCLALLVPVSFAQVSTDKAAGTPPAPVATRQTAQPAAQAPSTTEATTDAEPQEQKDEKKAEAKKGAKNDVDAIGNRDVGKRGMGNWYSLETDIREGKRYAQMIEQSARLVQDPVVNEYVNRIGQNLVRNSDAKIPFTIKVIDSDEINAFALPGGFFYVNSGLIMAADEEAELAGVMAHEIAHVTARHWARQNTRGQWANLATIPLIFMGGGLGYGLRSAASLALPLTFLSFSRGYESEADFYGMQYMYATGYDPQASISFFEKIQVKEKKKPGSLAKAFSTHPQTPDRVAKLQQEMATVLPGKDQYLVSTSEFDDVKVRLAAVQNRRKLQEDKDPTKPTLRRAGQTDKDKDGKTDDDRPTLKRRN